MSNNVQSFAVAPFVFFERHIDVHYGKAFGGNVHVAALLELEQDAVSGETITAGDW